VAAPLPHADDHRPSPAVGDVTSAVSTFTANRPVLSARKTTDHAGSYRRSPRPPGIVPFPQDFRRRATLRASHDELTGEPSQPPSIVNEPLLHHRLSVSSRIGHGLETLSRRFVSSRTLIDTLTVTRTTRGKKASGGRFPRCSLHSRQAISGRADALKSAREDIRCGNGRTERDGSRRRRARSAANPGVAHWGFMYWPDFASRSTPFPRGRLQQHDRSHALASGDMTRAFAILGLARWC